MNFLELDRELRAEYFEKAEADRLRYEVELNAFDLSLPLARKPLLEFVSPSTEQKETWLDICGAAADQASANRALLWSRYRRDHRDDDHDVTPGQSEQSFEFAALPPEIRREVYCWLLRQSRPVIQCLSKDVAMEHKQPLDLRILAVSRTWYSEALAVFLQENVVKILALRYYTENNIQSVISIASARWPFTRTRIRAVLIHMTYESRRQWTACVRMAQDLCSKLCWLSNLTKLEIEFCYEEFLDERKTERFEREVLNCFDALKSCGNFATQIVSASRPEL